MSKIIVENLSVEVDEKLVLENINIEFNTDETNVILGPNGAGKSTLVNVLMGNPKYKIKTGKIILNNKDITNELPEVRAKLGLFLSFQNPVEVEGITMLNFLRTSYNSVKNKNLNLRDFLKILDEKMQEIGIDKSFRVRQLNHNFSGGEKKISEILQLSLFNPRFAILDEIDSGLDVDAINNVGKIIAKIKEQDKTGFIVITHNNKILNYINPDKVCILRNKTIEKVGGKELLKQVEEKGFK